MNIFNSSKVEEEMNKDEMPLKYQEELKAHINKCMNVEAFPVFSSRIFEICKENKYIVLEYRANEECALIRRYDM